MTKIIQANPGFSVLRSQLIDLVSRGTSAEPIIHAFPIVAWALSPNQKYAIPITTNPNLHWDDVLNDLTAGYRFGIEYPNGSVWYAVDEDYGGAPIVAPDVQSWACACVDHLLCDEEAKRLDEEQDAQRGVTA